MRDFLGLFKWHIENTGEIYETVLIIAKWKRHPNILQVKPNFEVLAFVRHTVQDFIRY